MLKLNAPECQKANLGYVFHLSNPKEIASLSVLTSCPNTKSRKVIKSQFLPACLANQPNRHQCLKGKRKYKSSLNNRERKEKGERRKEKEIKKNMVVKRVFDSFNHVLSSRHYCQQKNAVDINV